MTTNGTGQHGGKREGAGRPPGARNKSTLAKLLGDRLGVEILSQGELSLLARHHAPRAVAALVAIAEDSSAPGHARVSAARVLLETGFGRPRPRPEETDPADHRKPIRAPRLVKPGDKDFDLPDLEVEESDA